MLGVPSVHVQLFGQSHPRAPADDRVDAVAPVVFATPCKIGKTGALVLTKSLAKNEGPHGITVNAISPGSWTTPSVRSRWRESRSVDRGPTKIWRR